MMPTECFLVVDKDRQGRPRGLEKSNGKIYLTYFDATQDCGPGQCVVECVIQGKTMTTPKREITEIAKRAIVSTLVNTGDPFKFSNEDPDDGDLDPALEAEVEKQINRVLHFLGYAPATISKGKF